MTLTLPQCSEVSVAAFKVSQDSETSHSTVKFVQDNTDPNSRKAELVAAAAGRRA